MPPPPPPPPGAPPPPTFNLANTQKPKLTRNEGNNPGALLASIAQGKRLKSAKHLMVDKSGPAVDGKSANKNKFNTMPPQQHNQPRGGFAPGGNRNVRHNIGPKSTMAPPVPSGNVSRNRSPAAGQRDMNSGATMGRAEGGNASGPPALAGLFAGGMPTLRKTGNRSESAGGNTNASINPPPPRSAAANPQRSAAANPPRNAATNPQRNAGANPPRSVMANAPRCAVPNASQGAQINMQRAVTNMQRGPAVNGPRGAAANPPHSAHSSTTGRKWPPVNTSNGPTPAPQTNHAAPRNNTPQPPSHTNKPSVDRLSVGGGNNNGHHAVNSTDNFRTGPPPPPPHNKAPSPNNGRGKPGTPSPNRPPPLGSRAAVPPPPSRAPPAMPVSNGPVPQQQRRSPSGLGSRPVPPVPSHQEHRPPTLPSRGAQPPPPPPQRTNNYNHTTGVPPPPARSPMTKVQPPVTPPPPPSRAPAARPLSSGRNSLGVSNGGSHPPPPPSRTCPRNSGGSGVYCDKVALLPSQNAEERAVEFERQFKFVQIDMLPPPPRFVQGPKTYPSKNAKNPANRRNLPPPPRPQ